MHIQSLHVKLYIGRFAPQSMLALKSNHRALEPPLGQAKLRKEARRGQKRSDINVLPHHEYKQ